MADWIDVAGVDEVRSGEPLAVNVAGQPIALFRLEDGVFALHDMCSHGRARLSDGFVEEDAVECPLHQGLICIRTGAPRSAPVTSPVKSFAVREQSGRIEIELP